MAIKAAEASNSSPARTGLIDVDPEATDLHGALDAAAKPLNRLGETEPCPGAAARGKIKASPR